MRRVVKAARLFVSAAIILAITTPARSQAVDVSQPGGSDRTLRGIPSAAAGSSLLSADVGGDTTADIIVGSPGANGVGRVSIFFGLPSSTGIIDLTPASADATIEGVEVGGGFGTSITTANRAVTPLPGKRELVVGAPGSETTAGRVYVFAAGRQSGTRAADMPYPDGAWLTIVGSVGERFGAAVAAADLNGDGNDEVIVGAPGGVAAGSLRGGRVYIYDMYRAGPPRSGIAAATTANLTLVEDYEILGSGLGSVLEAGGDVSGDGRADLAIGLPSAYQGRGAVALLTRVGPVPGCVGWSCAPLFVLTSVSVVLVGPDPGDRFGQSLTIADVTGSSSTPAVNDLIVGAPGGDGPGNARTDYGEVYIVPGGPDLVPGCAVNVTQCQRGVGGPDILLYGPITNLRTGEWVASGDIDRDGRRDLLISGESPRFPPRPREFTVVLAPSAGFLPGSVVQLGSDQGRAGRFTSEGAATAAVIDVPGERVNRVVIGAPVADAGRGLVHLTISPTVRLDVDSIAATLAPCATAAQLIHVENPSSAPVVWEARASSSWLTTVPGAGSARLGQAGLLRIVARPLGLAPGVHLAFVDVVGVDALGIPVTVRVNVTMTVLPAAPLARNAAHDFTGDGCADPVVFRPNVGTWPSTDGAGATLGQVGDWPVPGDYDGNLFAEAAVYRPSTSTWHIGSRQVVFGEPGDIPVPADYDGDGRTDIAVYRPSTGRWLIQNQPSIDFGMRGELPVPADYDGDGSADAAVYMPGAGTWRIRNQGTVQFGSPFDIPVPADYDGNGTADLAVYRRDDGTWYVKDQFSRQWGMASTVPLALDVTRDGRADLIAFSRADGAIDVLDPTTGAATHEVQGPGSPVVPAAVFLTSSPRRHDLDANGKSDLLWQNTASRQALAWYNDGALGLPSQRYAYLNAADSPGWTLVGSADFDGDTFQDLVWQHDATRGAVIWYMGGADGAGLREWRYVVPFAVSGWKIVAIGDVNDDGRPDLIWQRDASDETSAWFLGGPNGTSFLGWDFLLPPPSGSGARKRLVGVDDFNADAVSDLVWQDVEDGLISISYRSGQAQQLSRAATLNGPIPGWRLVGVADVNTDRMPDLIWQNELDQTPSVWYLRAADDGRAALQGYGMLSSFSVAGWAVIPR